jgi:YHS domain-containing protein
VIAVLSFVCGMRVDRAQAIKRGTGADTVLLCSEHCARAFDRDHPGEGPPSDDAAGSEISGPRV